MVESFKHIVHCKIEEDRRKKNQPYKRQREKKVTLKTDHFQQIWEWAKITICTYSSHTRHYSYAKSCACAVVFSAAYIYIFFLFTVVYSFASILWPCSFEIICNFTRISCTHRIIQKCVSLGTVCSLFFFFVSVVQCALSFFLVVVLFFVFSHAQIKKYIVFILDDKMECEWYTKWFTSGCASYMNICICIMSDSNWIPFVYLSLCAIYTYYSRVCRLFILSLSFHILYFVCCLLRFSAMANKRCRKKE